MKKLLKLLFLLTLITSSLVTLSCKNNKSLRTVELVIKVPTLSIQNSIEPRITESYQFLELAAKEFIESYKDTLLLNDDGKKVSLICRVVCFPIQEEDRYISQTFDTPDAPDVLYEAFFNMSTYIHTGRLASFDGVFSINDLSDFEQGTLAQGSVEGKLYMMPFLSLDNILCYNKTLFAQAGLSSFISKEPVIQTWSIDEWDHILLSLRKNLPSNIFPSMMYARNEQGDTHLMTLIKGLGADFYDGENLFLLNNEVGIGALTKIAEGVKKGFFPPNSEAMEIVDNSTMFSQGVLAIYLANSTLVHNFPNIDMGFVNFPSKEGALSTSFVTGFGVFDNGDALKLGIAKDFVRFIYKNPHLMDFSASAIPACQNVTARNSDRIFMRKEFSNNKKNIWDPTCNNPNWRGVRNVFYRNIQDLLTGRKSPKEVAQALEADCNAQIRLGRTKSSLHE